MGLSVAYLVEQVRIDSGLRNNQLYTNAQIARLLTDGYADLRDKMIVRFAHWFRSTYEFSLSGGEGANVLDLSLVPQLEMVQGLDIWQGDRWLTVDELPSFANRNVGGAWPLGSGPSFSGFVGRRYMLDGGELFVLPPQNAVGDYRLIYTPMGLPLAIPTTPPPHVVSLETGDVAATIGRWTFPAAGTFNDSDIGASFTVTGATNPGNNGTFLITAVGNSTTVYTSPTGLANETFAAGDTASIQQTSEAARTVEISAFDTYLGSQRQWSLANAAFTASDVGAVMTFDLAAPNRGFSGQYLISTVLSSTSVIVESTHADNPALPMAGTVVIDRRQLNTIAELPQQLTPWYKYIVLHASLAIRAGRRQPAEDLQAQMTVETARVVAVTKQRSEGIRQAPITRGWGGGGGWSGGGSW